jgi:hypothetical protein
VSLQRRGEAKGVLVFALREVRPFEELRGEDDFAALPRRLPDQSLDARDVDIARVAEGALNDGDAKLVVIHGEIGCGWVTQ